MEKNAKKQITFFFNFWKNAQEIKHIFLLFLVWRFFLVVVGFVVPYLMPFTHSFPYVKEVLQIYRLPYWLWTWGNFDGVHYLTIAKSAYSAQFTQVFFPLYPIMMKLISIMTFNNYLLAGLAISNFSFLLSIIIFYRIIKLEYGNSMAIWSTLYLLFFSFSFYFGAVYSESLFLLLILACFYFAKQKKWFLASIFGMLASLTRFVGVFLFPALIVEYYLQYQGRKKKKSTLFSFLLVPFGMLLYMIYLKINFNDPLYFIHAQPAFGASRTGGQIILLPQVLWRYFKIFASVPISQYSFWVAIWEILSTVFALILLVLGLFKRVRSSYLLFAFLIILVPTLTGSLSSMPRYIIVAFPIYVVLAQIENLRLRTLLLMVNIFNLAIFTSLFLSGHWVA